MTDWRIECPDSPHFDELVDRLREASGELEQHADWPGEQLRWCGESGVFAWFHTRQDGGLGWSEADLCRGYIRLGSACLTTAFVITQRVGACRRIAGSTNERAKARYLPDLMAGKGFATVGISHLTTSRRHLGRPALRAVETDDGFRLEGLSPWITGSTKADQFVVGATLEDGREILAIVEASAHGVEVPEAARLAALSASQTGPVLFHGTPLLSDQILAGPEHDVMAAGKGASTGGLQTSALAIGLADAAIRFLEDEASRRGNLQVPASALRDQWHATRDDLIALANGTSSLDRESLRQRANSLALRATQATLTAAKGTGYVWGHPANRWCREALFFLVWSCPQGVADANLCELSQARGR